MSDFYMYRYGFTPVVQEQSLFGGDQKKAATPSAALDAVLSDKQLPIHRADRRGGVEKYGNVCCSPSCGVTLIRLKNNCQVPLWKQNFERIHEPSYPYVDIIIDNRPGRCLMAIEKNKAFSKRPHDRNSTLRVRDILVGSLNEMLHAYGIEMKATPVTHDGEIWATVSHRIRKSNSRVKSIELSYHGDDEAAQHEGAIQLSQQLLSAMGGSEAEVRIGYARGDMEEIGRLEKDIHAIELFSRSNRYELNVTFDDMSMVRAGESLWAHFALPARDIADFMDGVTIFDDDGRATYYLSQTLDHINEIIIEFENQ